MQAVAAFGHAWIRLCTPQTSQPRQRTAIILGMDSGRRDELRSLIIRKRSTADGQGKSPPGCRLL